MSVAEEAAAAWAIAWELDKAAYHTAKAAYRKAQLLAIKARAAMSGNGTSATPATTSGKSGGGGKWSNEKIETEYYHTETTRVTSKTERSK